MTDKIFNIKNKQLPIRYRCQLGTAAKEQTNV